MTSNAQSLRTPSMFLSECDEEYSARVQHESNDMVKNNQIIPSDSLQLSKLRKLDLVYFIFSFHFLFYFQFIFPSSIFRTTRVRVDQSHCHSNHLMAKPQDRSQDLGEVSRRFENK